MTVDQDWLFRQDTPFLQMISDLSGLPCFISAGSFLWISDRETKEHPCKTDQDLLGQLCRESTAEKPCIFMENEYVYWGLMKFGSACVGIGPALCNSPEEHFESRYAAQHGLKHSLSLKKTGFGDMTIYLALTFCHFTGIAVPYDQIVSKGVGEEQTAWKPEADFVQYQLSQSEYDRSHITGEDFEKKLVDAVRNGDPDAVKKLIGGEMPDIGAVGEVAPEERRQMEYMVVSLITILTRAAIEGGMHAEAAHELGDVWLRRLAMASVHGGAFTPLGLRAMMAFADGVKQAQQERSSHSHVEACKAYIEENLLKNIQVGDIAPSLGLCRTYLSHLFQKEEGITIQNYIQREKCRRAEKMLKYSDYPIALISEYLGFSSPNYFGTCFQKWYGVTPGQYRRTAAQT